MSQSEIIENITESLMKLELVDSTQFKSENHYETTPNIFTVHPQYDADEGEIEMLGEIVTKLLRSVYPTYDIKASIEYRKRPLLTDDGKLKDFEPIKHLPIISIRWNSDKWSTEASDVRFEGYSITPPEGERFNDYEQYANKIFALDLIYQEETPELPPSADKKDDSIINVDKQKSENDGQQ